MCDTPLESWLNGLIGGKFISRRYAISTRRARLTAIAVPLVVNRNLTNAAAEAAYCVRVDRRQMTAANHDDLQFIT